MPPSVQVEQIGPSSLTERDGTPLQHTLPVAGTPTAVTTAEPQTVDDLVRRQAILHPNHRTISYPLPGTATFADYTLQQLDVFAWRVAKHYEQWIPARTTSSEKPDVVALLGPSDLEYLITMLAMSKLGHSVLLVSTRITEEAVASLATCTGARALIVDKKRLDTAGRVQAKIAGLEILSIAERNVFEFAIDAHGDTRMTRQLDPEVEKDNIAFIIHSSGSTGLPKPICQAHKACLANYAVGLGLDGFITLPLYHNHGICNLFRAIHARTSLHLYAADLPLTQEHLVRVLRDHSFGVFYGVPYALKLLSESDEGIDLLRRLKIAMYGGSACPDDLGDLLVSRGVNLVSHYGATEVGQLMTSFRPDGDKGWNYVREGDKVSPYLRWVPRGPNLYECVVTEGWPAKVQSNQPDGSYATKDLFEPHPTIAKAWKYVARRDDTLVLVNGEKFNPVAMEGSIRSNRNVTEAVVFGAGRPCLGVLVVPARALHGQSSEEILTAIWPVVEAANSAVDAFARISKDMVRVLPAGCEYPRTDKGSIIRQAFYKVFSSEIQEAYDASDRASADVMSLDLPELRVYLAGLLARTAPDAKHWDNATDFFSLGIDSLQAIQMRSEIIRTIDVGAKPLGQNVVFEQPTIERLAKHLYSLRLGNEDTKAIDSVEDQMKDMISKYTERYAEPSQPSGTSIVATGATGSLGAHVVAKLTLDPTIKRVYCLVRARDTAQAARRVAESLVKRRLWHTLPLMSRRKLVSLPSDLADPNLGLEGSLYNDIAADLRAVIHCAWSVNFSMHLSSFEAGNVAGVAHLLSLCRVSPRQASMNFCSSVSTCSRASVSPVPESVPELDWAQGMGYAQSKSVAEHICAQAQDVNCRILRVGQIVGDTIHGVWNAQEAVPMMMQTALTVGALPRLSETPSWLPVDTVAHAVTEISLSDAGSVFTNVTNPRTFGWTEDLLPALRAAGLVFNEVEPREWVARLRASNPDPKVNPPIKLVEFFASKYDKDEFTPSKTFATEAACALSPSLAGAPVLDQDLVNKFVGYFLQGPWKGSQEGSGSKRAIVVAGPCGTGKTTIGTEIAKWYGVPFLEGDFLHDKSSVDKMRNGEAMSDDGREAWLARIGARCKETLLELGYPSVVVSCSALKRSYRDTLRRTFSDSGVKTTFISLQAGKEALSRRLEKRTGHYMGADMIEGQLAAQEDATATETDLVPVDAEADEQTVLKEVRWVLETVLAIE